jgi:hypothetical protein
VAGHALQVVSETLELINFVWRCNRLAAAASLSLSRRVFILCDSSGRCDRLAAATSFRRTVKLWRFPSPLPGYNRLAAAASFPLSRKISRLCGSFGFRCDRLAAATSFRRICEALILLNSISRYNRLAAAAPFPLSRKVPRLFDSLCRRHCLSACRAFQTKPARVRALRFSISAVRLSRSAVSNRPLPIECSAQLRFKVAGPLKLSRKVLIRFPVQSATEDKTAWKLRQ